jgi:hypothetical protein
MICRQFRLVHDNLERTLVSEVRGIVGKLQKSECAYYGIDDEFGMDDECLQPECYNDMMAHWMKLHRELGDV